MYNTAFTLRRSVAAVLTTLALAACGGGSDSPAPAPAPSTPTATTLTGVAATGKAMAGATIKVYDATGATRSATAAANGTYSVDVGGLTAPLLIVATQKTDSHTLELTSIVGAVTTGASTNANVNQLTDRIVSDVATANALKGAPGLIAQGKTAGITAAQITTATNDTRALVQAALTAAGIGNAATLDPVAVKMVVGDSFDKVLDLLRSNRGYDSPTGTYTTTDLFDQRYMPLTSTYTLKWEAPNSAFAGTTIYVVGDSTASNYESKVAPREGWGQRFHEKLKNGANAQVLNLAQSGRSSRSFINEGWFQLVKDNIKAGDYLFIQFGHNDEKCGGSTPAVARDEVDIANLCTYPGTEPGIDAVTASKPGQEYSFRKSLKKYADMARAKGATPILLTPVTRRPSSGAFRASHVTTKGAYFGDYSAAVLALAAAENIAVVDVDAASISFFGGLTTPATDSLSYYLAVSEATYPYYTPATTGNIARPDNTHFQTAGAQKVGELVANGVKASARTDLAPLKALLN
ncbi:GDSL-type esterase/lipase family protein [Uliginosibacterium sp. H1]|uniref:GDSL-type esterase/lipase family protein n=1 Tax=Uliginosibacterium sp. H1 TaxID=3114757 RepID=UPI002E17CBBA|nr:GDSL-type esterase/lipase family protein [Uliginosibacterium sp. H1]